MFCQLSYAVRSVRVCDILELSLVLSISVSGVRYSGGNDVCDVKLVLYRNRNGIFISRTSFSPEC